MIAQHSTTSETYHIDCPICDAYITGAPAKYLHRCDVRGPGRKLLSREWIGYYEGRPVCYDVDSGCAQAELDGYVYELLSRTAVETLGAEADAAAAASTEAPLLVELEAYPACPFCDRDVAPADVYLHHCASSLSGAQWIGFYNGQAVSYDNDPTEAATVAYRYAANQSQFADPPVDPDPSPDPWPTDRTPIVAPEPICLACGKAHLTQRCPAIRELLMAPSAEWYAAELTKRFLEAA